MTFKLSTTTTEDKGTLVRGTSNDELIPSPHSPYECTKKLAYFILGFATGLLLMTVCFYEPPSEIQEIDFFRFQLSDQFQLEAEKCPRSLSEDAKYTPEQLHLSLGQASQSELTVAWATLAPVNESRLYVRTADPQFSYRITRVADGARYTTEISENGKKRTLYGYYASLNELPGAQYEYYVMTSIPPSDTCNSTKYFFSNSYNIKNPWYSDSSQGDPLRVAIFGDLGLINGQSIPRLISDVDNNKYDVIIHNGDFGYDLNDALGTVGDSFMKKIEPIAARVPYQTSVGNHEVAQNFSHYQHRFIMSNTDTGDKNSFYYSFDLGPVHFVAYSTEYYYFLEYSGLEPLVNQYKWLEADLAKANSREQRALRPWIIVFGHRPMYCSDRDSDDCSKKDNILRKGLPIVGLYSLEKLFYEQSVDLILEAHEHSYERFLPVYDDIVMVGKDDPKDPYLNPRAPVHLITGSAGCKESLDPFMNNTATGSVKQISQYGYTRLYASYYQLTLEQISDDDNGDIVDSFKIRKNKLRNFP